MQRYKHDRVARVLQYIVAMPIVQAGMPNIMMVKKTIHILIHSVDCTCNSNDAAGTLTFQGIPLLKSDVLFHQPKHRAHSRNSCLLASDLLVSKESALLRHGLSDLRCHLCITVPFARLVLRNDFAP